MIEITDISDWITYPTIPWWFKFLMECNNV